MKTFLACLSALAVSGLVKVVIRSLVEHRQSKIELSLAGQRIAELMRVMAGR